jgi:hypothetical protein
MTPKQKAIREDVVRYTGITIAMIVAFATGLGLLAFFPVVFIYVLLYDLITRFIPGYK